MVVILKNFDMQDCVHYKKVRMPGCCGRTHVAGVCTLNGKKRTCSLKMRWCKYEKEEDNVHPTELPNPNGGNN